MDIDKMLEIENLYYQYSSLLTDKQRDILSMHYEEDLSLGEISKILDISRQGVFDSLKRSEIALREYEDKLGLVDKMKKIESKLDKIEDVISSLCSNQDEIRDIIEEIRELI